MAEPWGSLGESGGGGGGGGTTLEPSTFVDVGSSDDFAVKDSWGSCCTVGVDPGLDEDDCSGAGGEDGGGGGGEGAFLSLDV